MEGVRKRRRGFVHVVDTYVRDVDEQMGFWCRLRWIEKRLDFLCFEELGRFRNFFGGRERAF